MRIASLLFVAALGACTGELKEIDPLTMPDGGAPPPGDAAMMGAKGDLAGQPARDMAGGGGSPDLAMGAQSAKFEPTIQNDLDQLGCSQNACHGSGSIPMKLVMQPVQQSDVTANYGEVKQRASSGAMSLLLTKNLTGSGVSHGGGKAFPSTMDATYQRWLGWINAGDPE